ncbi:response regulator [Sporosarcina sp. PTS2304]|uniref:ATP-binding protein n=1 Tax=Sporosarcina sp. PTS2304 TaxID=2283194 RepID=UPI000E0D1AB8|nr:ATP-binding protein [Sporosarcina sp. PTS2304]AXI00360.1 response regulator [Sporosarcina sp. PTS2304]
MSSKKGIRQQYINIFIISLLIAVIGMGSMYAYVKSSWSEMEEEQQETFEKAQLVEKISNSVQDLFFRIRGYYSFQIESELNAAYQAISDIHSYSREFNALSLTAEERRIISEIDNYLIEYENSTLPKAVQFVENNDYEGLRNLAKGGANLSVNRFIQYANEYNMKTKKSLTQSYDQTKKQTNVFFLLITLLGFTFLLIPIYMVWNVMNRVVRPVENITQAANEYQAEGTILFQPLTREDEIGALSQAIYKMMERIQSDEQELLSQNEELITQQDELFNRQTKMEYALSEARFTRVRLERMNGLSHLLSFSLDKQEVCNQTSDYLNATYQPDLSFIWFPKSDTHSLKGISEEHFSEIKRARLDYIKLRLETEPYFIIKREADYERGIAENTTFVYDFVAGIYNSSNELTIISILSRIGKPFTEDDQGDLYGLLKRIAISLDRIEQYELISHERQLNQNILDNINEGIRYVSCIDEQDKYNATLFELLGMEPETEDRLWPRDEWVEYFLSQIDDPDQYRAFLEETIDPANRELGHKIYSINKLSESSRFMNVYSVPVIINDEKVGTIFVHRDITHEHEVDRMKTELVSTVSHELRTPLSSILGFSELLLNKEMDENRQKRYLETIHSEANRLTALINDFLDIQRMESGRQTYSMEEVSVADLAKQSIDALLVQSDQHYISLHDLTCTSTVIADADRLTQVFTNLLNNAVKFSPDGGNIKVTLLNQQDSVIVSIEDEGIGIPAERIEHLFEKFYRFDNSFNRKIGGTGLGLSICKEIIKDHNGEIWVDSEIEVGTTIYFSLPIKPELPDHSIDDKKPLIIIVEDDVNIALLLGEELSEKGFSIVHHDTVDKAFTCIEEMLPVAVVVDLKLSDHESGWDLIRQMKAHEIVAAIPIIISSSIEKEPHLIEKFHINGYLTKPYPIHDISSVVLQAINRTDGKILYPENT